MSERAANRPFIQYGRDYSAELAGPNVKQIPNPAYGQPGPKEDSFGKKLLSPTTAWMGTDPAGAVLHLLGKKKRRKERAEQPPIPEFLDVPKYTESELAAMELANSPRFAELDENEKRAVELAASGVGTYGQDLERARELTERGAGTFLDADVQAYMNPYIKGVLDPAARELQLRTDRDVREAKLASQRSGAFGGSRGALLETETRRGGTQAMKDLYSQGYASAFESAASRFDADRNAAARGAEQFRSLGAQRQSQLHQDVNALLTTGGLRRQLVQQGLDFNYEQFLTARDWDVNNLKPLLAALATAPHTTTSTNEAKTGAMGNIIGIAATIAGAYFGGPQGAQAGASVLASQQNQGAMGPTGAGGGGGGGGTFNQAEQGPPEPGMETASTFRPGLVPIGQTFYGVPSGMPA
jgi:hypothetical protein